MQDPLVMQLAEWMRRERLGDAQMAARLGVHQSTVNRVRRGVQRPSLDLIGRIIELTRGSVAADEFIRTSLQTTKEIQA